MDSMLQLQLKNFGFGDFRFISKKRWRAVNMDIQLQKTEVDNREHIGEIRTIDKKTIETKAGDYFDYLDIVCFSELSQRCYKLSVPFVLTKGNRLYKLLERFGAVLKLAENLEIEDFIKPGMKVSYNLVLKNEYIVIDDTKLKPRKA